MSEKGKCSEIDEVPEEIKLNRVIGRLSKNKTLNVHGMQTERERSNDKEVELPNEEEMSSNACPFKLEDAIRNGQVVAATDDSMDGNLMVTHWIVTSFEHRTKIEGGVESTKWEME